MNVPHVLESIFLHLELDDLGRCRQVSARWRDFLDETEERVAPFRRHLEAMDFRRNLLHIGDVFGESSDGEEGEDEYPEDEDVEEEEENGGFERMSCFFSLFCNYYCHQVTSVVDVVVVVAAATAVVFVVTAAAALSVASFFISYVPSIKFLLSYTLYF